MNKYEADLKIVKEDGYYLRTVKKQNYEICLQAIDNWGPAIQFIRWKTTNLSKIQRNNLCKKAVLKDGELLKYVKRQTEEICLLAVRENPWALKYVKRQTERICIEAVKQWGTVLQLVKKQTPKICLEAVKQNSFALYYVKKQFEGICMIAVKQDGFALEYVKNQTYKICLEAVKQDGESLKYVKNQTKEICIEAVENDARSIQYIKWDQLKLTESEVDEMHKLALTQTSRALVFIKDKSKYIKMFNIKFSKNDRKVMAININGEWLFTVGCQDNITKEKFIHRIYNEGGGFDKEKGVNVHRQYYIDFLDQFPDKKAV
ncbi:TPA: DUF4116 domain-containing protein [Clostridioides difficile]|uniref:DUF4116 domain-containing protein n=1 Tax=Clostridioides difficile TaxID=1496 RepID=UPI000BB18180|nr:DUF4116 domain-containing protein [Clostridioides difficile]EGT3641042.1 DUF4116 domain-containing protein [Clostridioides difficile]MBH7166008.1 DUF4116 domain-containing protein [Clostridioides difficile]MBH7847068.1 DUF4116 domain-containing protein [Clostridioides difficile]MBY1348232.1 DUF4116 domain-containing protein [Clostridioides difficile]MBY1661757.1 DUF4116 domain-containing protein [Clostridioides difficile]